MDTVPFPKGDVFDNIVPEPGIPVAPFIEAPTISDNNGKIDSDQEHPTHEPNVNGEEGKNNVDGDKDDDTSPVNIGPDLNDGIREDDKLMIRFLPIATMILNQNHMNPKNSNENNQKLMSRIMVKMLI